MKAKRFTEEQIIAVLKQVEAESKTKELCRNQEHPFGCERKHDLQAKVMTPAIPVLSTVS